MSSDIPYYTLFLTLVHCGALTKLNCDLPSSHWRHLLKYLEPHIEESEIVEKFAYAIKSLSFEESLESKFFQILSANGSSPFGWPDQDKVKDMKGGAVFLRTNFGPKKAHWTEFRKTYFEYLEHNFRLEQKK